jgi:ABC-type glycerol-3-phosphate transport system substrate-binding protein
MTQRFTRAVLPVLACALVIGLAACGGSSNDKSSSDASSGSTKATTTAPPKNLSGTLTVWDLNYTSFPGYTKAAKQLDQEFQAKYPNVTIKHVAQPFAKYDQILQAAFTGRKGPDVMMLVGGQQGVLRWTKGLDKLNDRVTSKLHSDLTGWASTAEGFDPDGAIYGVPVGLQGVVFYYNKKLFKKAGLDADFAPKSWDDVKAAGLKLKAAGITPFTGGDKEGYENQWWFTAGWNTVNTPDQARALANGKIDFTSSEFAKAVSPELDMQRAGLFDSNRFATPLFPDGAAAFGQGKGAMFLGLWSTAAYYGDYVKKLGANNVGTFLPPGANAYVSEEPGWAWSIPSFGSNKDAAWAYIQFLTSDHGNETMYTVGGSLPNDKNVAVAADAPPQERTLIEATRSANTFPDVHQMIPGKVLNALSTEMNEALQNRKSLQAVQVSLQKTKDQA